MDLDRKPTLGGSSSDAEPDPNTNSDRRSQVSLDTRQRMGNQIMDTMKKHLPVPAPEGSSEVEKIAIRFEEKIFGTATSEPDYAQKVSLKMLSMETKVQPGMNPPLSSPLGVGMTSQQPGLNPSQSLAMAQPMIQPPASMQQQQLQQPLLQDIPNLPSLVGGGPSGVTIPQVSGPSVSNHNSSSVPGETSGPGWSTGCLPIDMYSYTQRKQPPQQLMSQNQMLYQQQLAMHQNLQQQQQRTQMQMASALPGGSGTTSAVLAGGMQQNQMNSVHKQPVGQAWLFQHQPLIWQQQQQLLPSMQDPTVPMQQMNNVTESQQQQLQMLQNQMQQNQFQLNQMQQNQLQLNQMQLSQMLSRQQNQLLGSMDTGNMNNMQSLMQMQRQVGLLQQQQQHLLSQFQLQQLQMPQQQLERPQQLSMMQQRGMQMLQQGMQASPVLLQMQNINVIDPLKQQQQQFIPQMQEPLQQQRVLQGIASSSASTDSTAETGHPGDFQEEIYQMIKYLKDTYFNDLREIYQKLSMKLSHVDSIVPPNARGGEQIERMKNFKTVLERMMAVLQLGKHSIHIGLKDKLPLYEKQILNILLNNKKALQQQTLVGGPDRQHSPPPQQSQPVLQNSNAVDLQRQQQQQVIPQQQQSVLQDVASSSQQGHPGDLQEELYQKLKDLKDTYFADLRDIHQKLSMKLNEIDLLSNARGDKLIEKMKNFKLVLERMMKVLQLGKHNIHIGLKDKLSLYEKQVLSILQHNKKALQPKPQAEPTRRVKPRTCQVCGTCAHKRRDQ